MIFLKGDTEKMVVLKSLMKVHRDSYVIIYDIEPIKTMKAFFISSGYYNIEELCDSIKRDIQSECKPRSMIIVYTNLPEDELGLVKNLLEEFEVKRFCKCGIATCK